MTFILPQTKYEVADIKYGLGSNGWTKTDLFEAWFIEHNAMSASPLFFLLDGHSLPTMSDMPHSGAQLQPTTSHQREVCHGHDY